MHITAIMESFFSPQFPQAYQLYFTVFLKWVEVGKQRYMKGI